VKCEHVRSVKHSNNALALGSVREQMTMLLFDMNKRNNVACIYLELFIDLYETFTVIVCL